MFENNWIDELENRITQVNWTEMREVENRFRFNFNDSMIDEENSLHTSMLCVRSLSSTQKEAKRHTRHSRVK